MQYRPITQWHEDDRPREKLLRLGAENLSDAELMAILLGSGYQQTSAVDLAQEVLHRMQGYDGLDKTTCEDLTGIKGIGPAKAVAIKAVIEIGKRLAEHTAPEIKNFSRPSAVYNYFRFKLRNATQEQFHTLLLNQKNNLIKSELITQGTLTASIAHPREVLKGAISASAAAFIAVHNHPSGNTDPSPEDLDLTRRLKEASEIVGIRMLDHIIIGYDTYVSLFEMYPEFRQ